MNFLFACLAWLVIAFLIGLGIFLAAVKGSIWLLVIVTLAFIVGVYQIGCKAH